ncbi:hypothetical protein DVH05_008237 [Phytophthora capsici]|nr:hypothetical protein DVH05_008237 [Phytophthora capsici]
MVMVKLFCMIVGEVGTAFSVDIADGDSVDDLKKAIAENQKFGFAASKLQLFLSKKKNDTDEWLTEKDVQGGVIRDTSDLKPLVVARQILSTATDVEVKIETKAFEAETSPVNVLVVVPERDSTAEDPRQAKLTYLDNMLKNCTVVGELPEIVAILNLFEWTDDDCGKVKDIERINNIVHLTGPNFFVRKEILCVLENFKNSFQEELNTGKLLSLQMVLMGSPGTGKSCILALLCFHVAVQYELPVLWFRQVDSGLNETVMRLLYQGKYYEWKDQNGAICESLDNALRNEKTPCWVFLDGMTQKDVKKKAWNNMYKVLATSGQFKLKSESIEMKLTKTCLVPYWRRKDLEAFGRYLRMDQAVVDARLFVSGGSVKEFLDCDRAKTVVKAALKCIEIPEDAENLIITPRLQLWPKYHEIGCHKKIDLIYMRGVQDRNNAKQYVDVLEWTGCVMSKYVLQHLAAMMKPEFLTRLMEIAKEMNDDRLEDVALEAYFHSLVRHQRSIRVEFCKYDNVDRSTLPDQEWKDIMNQEVGSIEVVKFSVVKCKGEDKNECVAMMESWAANPEVPVRSCGDQE